MSLQNSPSFVLDLSERDLNTEEKHFFEFKPFRLNLVERQLLHNDSPVALTPKAFDVLALLVERSGHLVKKEEFLESIWPDSFVEEQNITKIIFTLRRTLGEDDNGNKFIETVARKGYRFVAPVREICELENRTLPHENEVDAPAEDILHGPSGSINGGKPVPIVSHETPPAPIAGPKQTTRAIFFSVVLVSTVVLLVLLSSNFRFESPIDPNGTISIAVLPIKPLAPESREVIYEMGIADSLILKLSTTRGLRVRPLSATRKYADAEHDAIAAGREQNVDYVLDSTYQIDAGKIRVTARLVNVSSGQVEEVLMHEQTDLSGFAVQDAVVPSFCQKILKKLNRGSSGLLVERHTSNEEAYRLYLVGAALADKPHHSEVRKAIEYFEQAVQLDPNYSLAYARLANAETSAAWNRSSGAQEQYPKAKAAIEKALALDDKLAEAYSYSAEIKAYFEGNFKEAKVEHKRAIDLNPNSPVAHRTYAVFLTFLGRHDEAIAEIKTAIDLEPASALNQLIFGRSLLFARRYDEAIIVLERTAEMDPTFFFPHQSLSLAYRYKGEDDRAFDAFLKARVIADEEPESINSWKSTYAEAGWRGVLERQLEQAKENERSGKPNYNQLANLSSELGHTEEAFAYLEKAIVQNLTLTMLKVHPRFDRLRSDPRFDELLGRAGLK